jgi:chorismate-pyruvate lyase
MRLSTAPPASQQGQRVDRARSVDPRGLDLLQRLLLGTDATVTQFLATAMGEPIEAIRLSQRVRVVDGVQGDLELGTGQCVLDRRVLLRGATSRRNFLHGESVIALGRVPREVRAGLLRGDTPIGLLLRQHRMETFREILWSVGVVDPGIAPHFLLAEGTPLLARRYRVWIDHRPVMVITETFPRSYGPAPGPPGSAQTTDLG